MFIQQGFAYLPSRYGSTSIPDKRGAMLFFRVQGGHNS